MRLRRTFLVMMTMAMGAMGGCITPDYVTNDESLVLLRVDSYKFDDDGKLTTILKAYPKNPNLTSATASGATDVLLYSKSIRYFRTDGLNIEGRDVPYAWTESINGVVPYNGTLTITGDGYVRSQMFQEPPISLLPALQANVVQTGQSTGAVSLTLQTQITYYGRTANGAVVSTTTQFALTF